MTIIIVISITIIMILNIIMMIEVEKREHTNRHLFIFKPGAVGREAGLSPWKIQFK